MGRKAYNGCEMESPLYRQVAKEMEANRDGITITIGGFKTKRGKRSKW